MLLTALRIIAVTAGLIACLGLYYDLRRNWNKWRDRRNEALMAEWERNREEARLRAQRAIENARMARYRRAAARLGAFADQMDEINRLPTYVSGDWEYMR